MIPQQLRMELPPKPRTHHGQSLPIDKHFDVEFANALARIESFNKHLYRPNTYLHKWWARRCGSTFRLILKCLADREDQRDYYSPGGLEGKIILDPMMGGGTTLHEAIRMGASVIGADLDPIPVLQVRASLSTLPLIALEKAFSKFYKMLHERLSQFYATTCPVCQRETEVKFTLYGLKRFCDCGTVLFVDSTVLRHESGGAAVRICPQCMAVRRDRQSCECGGLAEEPRWPLREKGAKACPVCRSAYRDFNDLPLYQRYFPLVIVGCCRDHDLFFRQLSPVGLADIERADQERADLDFGDSKDFAVKSGPKSIDLIRHGVGSYLDLFSSRQLLYLKSAIDLMPLFEPDIRLNLALLVSTSLEFNSILCGYKGADERRPGAVRHTFSHHAYSFPHTALENNPLYPGKTSGTLQGLFHSRILRARQWASLPKEKWIENNRGIFVELNGEVDAGVEVDNAAALGLGNRRFLLFQGSSASLDLEPDSVDYIVTDPPYFDSVQYSDLAIFFRVWLKRLLPDEAQWDYDIAQSAVDPHANGNGQYTRILGAIFSECHRVLKKDTGRLIFTFHHWNPKGWTGLTVALKKADFTLVNRYIVHSENPISVHIAGLKALKHDAILVMAPLQAGTSGKWEPPKFIDKSDSLKFCQDCATALGWMLSGSMKEVEIERKWDELLA
jgi:putative DNA methylase